MRILYHHRTHAEDGQAVHIRALQQAFAAEGHEVHEVALVPRGGSRPEPARTGASGGGGVPVRPSRWAWVTRLPPTLRELAEYGYTVPARQRLVREAKRSRPDFIYERYAFGNAGGVLAARRLGVPLVLEVNSPLVLELSRTRGLTFEGLAHRVERFVFLSADCICVVSGVLREMLIEMGVPAKRLRVIPNGVHLERFDGLDPKRSRAAARQRLGLPAESENGAGGPVLGFAGYYRRWHKLDLAIQALTRPELAGARLVLIGWGPAHDRLQALARELAVGDRVLFAGSHSHDEIPDLLPAFDIALIPGINAYSSPLKLQEYMAAGLAVIAPDQPNLREVLSDRRDALLFKPGDAEGFTAAILELAADRELRRAIGEQARRVVTARDLTWRANARRVLAAVEELRQEERAPLRARYSSGGVT